MALPAARAVSRQGDSGSGSSWMSIWCEDTQQAGVRAGRRLVGVRRPCGGKELAQRRWVGLKRWHVLGRRGVSCFPLAKISKSMNYAQEFVNTKSVEGI